MKSKIKKIFIYALLLSLISCGSSGGNKDTEKTPTPTPKPKPADPNPKGPSASDVYYNGEIVIRNGGYSSQYPNGIILTTATSDIVKIPNIAGTPIKKQDYQTSSGTPMNEKIFLHSTGTTQQVTDFSSDLTASNSYRAAIGGDLMDEYIARVNSVSGGDNLYIWPAGNIKGNKNPSLEGGLPYFEKSLEKSWINVVALVNKSGTAGLEWKDLEPLSNAGVASKWTITAVSEDGTSAKAAENVAKAVDQVREKFPGMKMDMIRDIILSTATDIGAAGVDDVFGYGLLDATTALNGPKRLDYGTSKFYVPNTKTWVFKNNIYGSYTDLEKSGKGTLVLEGKNSFYKIKVDGGTLVLKGDNTSEYETIIKDGILDVKKKFTPENIEIETNGTLITNPETVIGEISKNYHTEEITVNKAVDVVNKGTLKNIGTGAIITGNYTAKYGSVTEAEIGSKLIVKGTIKIDGRERNQTLGSSVKLLSNGYVTATPTTSTVIEAEKGIEGQFAKVETDGLINGKVENKGNSIEATISRKNVEDYVNSLKNSDEMQKNTAKNVEVSFKELDKKIAEGNANVSNFALGAAKLQKNSLSLSSSILDSLSGQIYASAQALTFQQSQTINKDLSNRLVMLGTLDNASDKFGLWISSIGANGKLKQNGYAEGKTKVYGGQVGIDKQFGENLILGTALAYSKGNVKFDRHGGKSDADNFGISLYGRVGNKDNPMYLQGRVGLGFVNSEVKRDIILSENDISRGKIEHNDKVISGYLETGYDVKKGDFVLTPFAGISHDTVQRGAFHEENSQFGLKADKKTYKQTSGLAGVRVSQKFNFENGSKTTLQGYITHQRAFNNENLNFKASYSGLPDAKFKVKGIGLSKSQTWVGAGVLNEANSKFAWYLNYDGKIDKKAKNNVFTAGMRVNF